MEDTNNGILFQTRLLEFYKRAMMISEELVIDYHKFRKQRTEKGFKSICEKLYSTETYIGKLAKSKTLLSDAYLGNKGNFLHENIYTLRNEYIESELTKARTSSVSEYVYLQVLGILTGNNAIDGMKEITNLYLECANKIHKIRKDNKVKRLECIPKGHVFTITDNNETNIKNAILYMEDRIKKGNYSPLNEIESNDIRSCYNGMYDISSNYYSINTLNKLLSICKDFRIIRNYNKKESFKDSKMLEAITGMAINVYDTLSLRLLSDNKDNNYRMIVDTCGINIALNKYIKSYDLFVKYYNDLSNNEQEDIRTVFEGNSFDTYREVFDISEFHIISGNELKNRINDYISSKVINKHSKYTSVYYNEEIFKDLNRTLELMDTNDIVELYKQLCFKERQDYLFNISRYQDDLDKKDKAEEDYNNRLMNLQKEFAILIATRISSMKYEDYLESSQETIKSKEELLFMVVRDYLKEKVLFPTVYNEVGLHIDDGISLEDIEKAKVDANKRFYKLNKVQQSLTKINGSWNKYNSLIAKTRLNVDEVETLNSLFR